MYQDEIRQINNLLQINKWKEAVEMALKISFPSTNKLINELQAKLCKEYDTHIYYDRVGAMHHLDYLEDRANTIEALNSLLEAMK